MWVLGSPGFTGYAMEGELASANPLEFSWRGFVRSISSPYSTEVQSWPAEDRLRLIEELWDGLADDASEPELSEDLKDLLDRRLAALDADPDNVVTWEEIKAYVRRPR